MSLANPFVNPPRLSSPSQGRIHARSASRSPTRRQARDTIDPLLRDLSPATTLRAFVADPPDTLSADPTDKADVLAKSIQTSSASQRALGAQAAQACLHLRTWTRELESWHWPDTFDVPEPARKKLRLSTMTFNSAGSNDTIATVLVGDDEEEYWGSLPATLVQAYEKRADEIGQALDQIDVEELKDYVLTWHYRVDSRPPSRDDSIASIDSTTEVKHLDDFTAIVTATILQALPYLSRLNRLLDIWSIRLTVLRQSTNYLVDLKRARTDLDHGWAAIAVAASSSGHQHAQFNRQIMLDMKSVIENQVTSLGRRLDRFLDRLEGRDDTIPEIWLEEFELLETAYGDWVVQAEQKVLQLEWRDTSRSSSGQANSAANGLDETTVHTTRDSSNPQSRNMLAEPATDLATGQAIDNEPAQPELPSGGLSSHPVPVAAVDGNRGRSQVSPIDVAESSVGQLAKRRAAFLNDIERTNSLKPTKTPVRSFEHASNAFTRLFRKDRSPEHARPKRTASGKLSAPSSIKDRSTSGERQRLPSLSPMDPSGNVGNASRAVSLPMSTPRLMQSASEPNGLQSLQDSHFRPSNEPPTFPSQLGEVGHLKELRRKHTKPTPTTYQPTGLSSNLDPLDQPTIPDNWPLTSPMEAPARVHAPAQRSGSVPALKTDALASESEIYSPVVAMQTDTFDRMFVQSLPDGNTERPSTAQVRQRPSPSPWAVDRRRTASLPRVAHSLASQRGDAVSYPDIVSTHQSRETPAVSHTSHERVSIDSKSPGTDMVGSNAPSGDSHSVGGASMWKHNLPLGSREIPLPILGSHKIDAAKRASVASIEAFPRSELKTIDVQRLSRQNSITPKVTPPGTPPRARTPSDVIGGKDTPDTKNSAMSYKGMVSFPSPAAARPSLSTPSSELASFRRVAVGEAVNYDHAQDSPGLDEPESPPAPLNAVIRKRRDNIVLQDENEDPSESIASSPTNKRRPSPDASEDSFDRHVSEVLERLPAQIKFRARPGAVTPASRASEARGAYGPRPKNMRAPPKQGAMTIAPAEASPRKQSSSNDPEVKLYHLTQAGREDPIRLFVRLVGEGERVMVRVGGGWADLADYLRQYAEHHGSRTVSEGGLEVQTMSNTPLARKVSGPADAGRAKTPLTPLTPANATPRPSSKDSELDWPSYSQPTFSSTNGRSTPVQEGGRQTPGVSTQNSTPKSTSTGNSRPSTANVSRPPSRQSTGEAVGLAGMSGGKKAGLPDHKVKWVEGMIERAKKASAEKSKEEREKHFNELGKAGSTRRVIFKSG